MRPDDAIERSIGDRIKAARQYRGMSLMALAAELGLTYQQVRKYETGKNRISASMLFKAADSLGFETTFFFAGCSAAMAGQDAPIDLVPGDSDGVDLQAALGRVQDDEIRAHLTGLVRALERYPAASPRTQKIRS